MGATPDPLPAAPAGHPPTRVLVVDDEPAHVEAIRRAFLEAAAPIELMVARSLSECRELAAARPPDIALVDLNLPDGRAIDLFTVSPGAPVAFPVLVMTSHGNEQTAVEALKVGALDYVVKSAEAFSRMPRTAAAALREWRALRERRAAEATVARLNANLEQRVAERTVQLEAAVRELEFFAYSVSHDLRAPLRAIEGFAGMLAENYGPALDPEGRRLIGVVRANAKRMDALISDLLNLSRLARSQLHRARVDMAALAAEVFEEIATPEEQREVAFVLDALPESWADAGLARQVWSNLLSNALKYSRPKAQRRIVVEGRLEGAMAHYTVRDTGVGFDPAFSYKLFRAFERLHAPGEFEGTGVGLAIVKRIVERHGGQVLAEGTPGEGAAFTFSLPAPRPAALPRGGPTAAEEQP